MEPMAPRALLLSLLLLSQLQAGGVTIPFPVHVGERIERVVLPTGQYFQRLEEGRSYLGDFPRMVFHNFHKFKGRFGTFYLIDLSKDGKYFDALPYDTLKLHTGLKHFRLALADESLAKKEANRFLAVDEKEVSLHPGMKGLRLRRLKYAVIFTEEPLERVELLFEKRRISMSSLEPTRAVWAWKSGAVEPARLVRLGIDKIYLQTGPGFSHAVRKLAYFSGIEVYALDGSPGDIDCFDRLKAKFERLPLEDIRGIQLDIEPYLLEEYRSTPQGVLQRYVDFLHRMKEWCHRRQLRFSIVTPFWFASLDLKGEPFFPKILKAVDEVVLMSYRSDPQEVLRISADALRWGEWLGKKVAIGVELKALPDEKHFIYRVEAAGPCISGGAFHPECHELKLLWQYLLRGSSLSFYRQPEALKRLLEMEVPYRSFGGFVFHDQSMLERFESVIE
jgi:hypothetical protein